MRCLVHHVDGRRARLAEAQRALGPHRLLVVETTGPALELATKGQPDGEVGPGEGV